jgi:histone-lysine N-methyltransferase SETMAR
MVMTVDVSTVHCWAINCKGGEHGRAVLCDKQRSGRPLTAADEFHRKADELIKDSRWIIQRDIAAKLGISQERVSHMIAVLQYRKICARWVPRMLTAEMKASRVIVCQQLLSQYEKQGEEFLHSVVTADEMWVHHYESESKHQSTEYHHKVSPAKKKFKTQALARKLMATVFWDADGFIHLGFLESGTTINSERYIRTPNV